MFAQQDPHHHLRFVQLKKIVSYMYCLLRFQTMAVTTHLVTKTGTGVTDPAELHCCMMNLDHLMCYTTLYVPLANQALSVSQYQYFGTKICNFDFAETILLYRVTDVACKQEGTKAGVWHCTCLLGI
jgi:hypothetical protein